MRRTLANLDGARKRFRAVFVRLGKKTNYKGYSEETLLLQNVVDLETNKVVTSHIWFSFSKGFETLSLKEGVTLEFDARIKEYRKGYINRKYQIDKSSFDFKLSHPTKLK